MKILLLPGLDGTGHLFSPLVQHLPKQNCQIIPLPTSGDQSFDHQFQHLKDHLPTDDFILLAESFSGPTAAMLAANPPENLKGIIFVATFLTTPNRFLIKAAMTVPVPKLLNLPGARTFLKYGFLRQNEDGTDEVLLHQTLKILDPTLIHKRLIALTQIPKFDFLCPIPALYLRATHDTIVPGNKQAVFRQHFPNLTTKPLQTTHLILQTKPKQCALIIKEFMRELVGPAGLEPATRPL